MKHRKRFDPDAVTLDLEFIARSLGITPADVERRLRAAIAAGFLTLAAVHRDHVTLRATIPGEAEADD